MADARKTPSANKALGDQAFECGSDVIHEGPGIYLYEYNGYGFARGGRMIIDGCKRTSLLATLLVGGMMCVPSAANADAIVTLSGPTSNAAHGEPLPTRPVCHLIDCRPFGSAQHCDHRVLLRRALRVGLRLRQDFNCRPQLIDQ